MRKLFYLLFFISTSTAVFSQGITPTSLLYSNNMNMLNPAYAGFNKDHQINLGFRKQSYSMQEELQSQFVSYSRPFKGNLGLGLSIVNHKFFINRQTDIAVDASYKLKLNDLSNLSFGMKLGGVSYAIDYTSLGVVDPLLSTNVSSFNPLIGIGALLKGERYYLHVSIPNLLSNEIDKPKEDSTGAIISESTTQNQPMYFGGGYRFSVSKSIELTPSIFSRVLADTAMLVDIATLATFNDSFSFGLGYRLDTSIIGILNFKVFRKFSIGLAYESISSDFSTISSGSTEFTVSYIF